MSRVYDEWGGDSLYSSLSEEGQSRPAASFSEALEAFRSSYPGRNNINQLFGEDHVETRPNEGRPAALSVSAAMHLAKGALESVTVRMLGEVSEVNNKAGYKAVYFTVKDEHSSLPCMMWTNRYKSCGVSLAVGNLVEISGRFTLYAAKGRMNFDVFTVSLAGEGDLRMRVAAIARRLDAEGLTASTRKRPIPALPTTIGVVTSPRGAAVHDVLRTLRRRYPMARMKLAGVPVEGANAAAGIVEGINVVARAGAEVVLVVRGGGSFEDLMPFNDENLARAIAACPVPVVTGIGHEPDTTIADMVSDLRASTPTAAAEAVSPGMDVLAQRVSSQGKRMHDCLSRRLERSVEVINRRADRPIFKDPAALLAGWAQGVDDRADRLGRALPNALDKDRVAIESMRQRLLFKGSRLCKEEMARLETDRAMLAAGLPRVLDRPQERVDASKDRMAALGATTVSRFQQDLALAASRLNDLSPLAVLARGYAIARDGEGSVIRSVAQVAPGDKLSVTVSDGTLECAVVEAIE